MNYRLLEQLEACTDRYLTADVHGALSALLEAEELLRVERTRPSSQFAVAIMMAKRSDILFHLGEQSAATLLLDEALKAFQGEPLAIRGGLLTPKSVLTFVRRQDAQSNVRWRQEFA